MNNNGYSIQNNNYLIWLFIYMGIGFAISFIIPFPLSIGVLFLVLFSLNDYRIDHALRKQGMGGIKGLFKSKSSLFAHKSNGPLIEGYNPIKYFCMNCGYELKNNECPKCGSKAVKVG